MRKSAKANLFYILLFAILSAGFAVVNSNISFNKMITIGDGRSFSYAIHQFTRISVLEYHQFPHWNPYYYGGTPFFANAQNTFFTITDLLSIISPTIEFAMTFIGPLILFMAGVFMFFLMRELKFERIISFISGVVFMFGGFLIETAKLAGNEYRLAAYIWIPLLFFFCIKSIRSRSWIKYSLLIGIILAVIFHTGAVDFFLWIILFISSFFAFNLIGKNIKKRITKIMLIGVVLSLIFFGLISVKLFPLIEYKEFSNKQIGFSFEQSIGAHLNIEKINDLIKPIQYMVMPSDIHYPINIGFLAFIILLFSLLNWRNRYVIFLFSSIILFFLVSTGSFFYYLLWKFIPGFSSQHHIIRALFVVVFASSILMGFGLKEFLKVIKSKFNLSKKSLYIICTLITIIFLFEMSYFTSELNYLHSIPPRPLMDFREELNQNQLLQYITQQEGIFRIHNFKTNMVGGYAQSTATPLKLQILYGFNNVWIPEYFNVYLGIAHNAPEKFYGMLNTKYIYSNDLLNRTSLKLIKKFRECEICKEDGNVDVGIDGPYLYENKLFLPRAYTVPNSILVAGEEDSAKQAMYSLMLDQGFNPSNTVIIMGEHGLIDNYDIDFLKKFNAIFLTQGSVSQNSYSTLKQYTDFGGILLPDIINGKNSITSEDITQMWNSFKGSYKEMPISYFSPNKIILSLNKESGFMVLSEKFFMFEGWKASISKKDLEILRADGISSAVYLDGAQGNLTFHYSSKTFKKGAVISSLTLVIILAYFGFLLKRNYLNTYARK